MHNQTYQPVLELTRGEIVESFHFGAIAVSDSQGQMLAWYGDPHSVAFLRSTAKPFQALPFIECGGQAAYKLTDEEIALICSSHSGTDEHVAVVQAIQAKTGVSEGDLLCGIHSPSHEPTAEAMRLRGEEPTQNRNNCSGKHTGMIAFAKMQNWPIADYLNPSHPVQEYIIQAFAEMCSTPLDQIEVGIDGCSAPNFAVPLVNAALAYARLCDPAALSPPRAAACRTTVKAMTRYPFMIAGPGRFDTRLMEVTKGRIVSKSGAEGYQGLGLIPGAIRPDSPALGIALKIADGDLQGRARPAISLEVLRQLGALTQSELGTMAEFGPKIALRNWRNLIVGEMRPCFLLQSEGWLQPARL